MGDIKTEKMKEANLPLHLLLVGLSLGDPDVDGRIILRWIFRKWEGVVDWMELAQDRDRWRALVNTVRNLRVP